MSVINRLSPCVYHCYRQDQEFLVAVSSYVNICLF